MLLTCCLFPHSHMHIFPKRVDREYILCHLCALKCEPSKRDQQQEENRSANQLANSPVLLSYPISNSLYAPLKCVKRWTISTRYDRFVLRDLDTINWKAQPKSKWLLTNKQTHNEAGLYIGWHQYIHWNKHSVCVGCCKMNEQCKNILEAAFPLSPLSTREQWHCLLYNRKISRSAHILVKVLWKTRQINFFLSLCVYGKKKILSVYVSLFTFFTRH